MSLRDYTNKYEFLRQPARRATETYEKANRWFDQLKELILIELGLAFTSKMFHETAHTFPEQFDKLGDILHQKHIIQDYGATPEFPGVELELGDMFQMAVDLLDEIETALGDLIKAADMGNAWSLARQFEELQVENSQIHEKYLYAWRMYEEATSPTSFDSWVEKLNDDYEEEEDDD